ncbi:MAG: CARDB domain-containing protein, partial [Gaiellaceae bacterium]
MRYWIVALCLGAFLSTYVSPMILALGQGDRLMFSLPRLELAVLGFPTLKVPDVGLPAKAEQRPAVSSSGASPAPSTATPATAPQQARRTAQPVQVVTSSYVLTALEQQAPKQTAAAADPFANVPVVESSVGALPPETHPLIAASAPPAGAEDTTALTQVELDEAVAQAAGEWGADVSGLTFTVADLPDLLLGATSGTSIEVDTNAAGWGWAQMNLLTVVRHEIGHYLGHDHDEGVVMAETLAAGESRAVPAPEPTPEPALVTAPASADLGFRQVGTSASGTVTVSNGGASTVDITAVTVSSGSSFAIVGAPAPATIAPSATLDISVSFAPASAGAAAASLTIEGSMGVLTVDLAGLGTAPELVAPASADLGDVMLGATGTQTIELANTGDAELAISDLTIVDDAGGDFAITSPVPAAIGPGGSASISVSLTPNTAGVKSARLVVASDNPGGTVEVTLGGRATAWLVGGATARAPPPEGATLISTTTGGTATSSDGSATVVFPAGSSASDIYVTVTPSGAAAPPTVVPASPVYELAAYDPDGNAVTRFERAAEFTIQYSATSRPPSIFYLDAEGGAVELDSRVDPGAHTVTARLPHFSTYLAAIPVDVLDDLPPVVETTIEVTVRKPDLTPLAGQEVEGSSDTEYAVRGVTDSAGVVSFGVSRGHWTFNLEDLSNYRLASTVEIDALDAGPYAVSIDVEEFPVYVSGVVRDASGNALGGVRVNAQSNDGAEWVDDFGVSATDGSYRVGGIAGDWWINGEDLVGYYPENLEGNYTAPNRHTFSGPFTANGTQDLTYTLLPRTFTGSLKDQNGNGAAGVPVEAYVYSDDWDYSYYVEVVSAADGTYTIRVPNDVNEIDIYPEYEAPGFVDLDDCCKYWSPPEPDDGANIVFTEDFHYRALTAPASGVVRDSDGHTIGGVEIEAQFCGFENCYYLDTETAADGSWTILGDAGDWTLYIDDDADGYTRRGTPLTVPETGVTGVELFFVEGALVSGTLTLSDSGATVGGAQIRVCGWDCFDTRTNSLGEFRLWLPVDPETGSYTDAQLRIDTPRAGYGRESALISGATGDTIARNLQYVAFTTTYSGTAHDSFGSPVTGAIVRVTNWTDEGTATTAADGSWSLVGPAGTVYAVADQIYPKHASAQIELTTTEGSANHGIALVLPTARVAGSVVDDLSAPLEGVTIRIDQYYYYCFWWYCPGWQSYGTLATATTDAAGAYSVLLDPAVGPGYPYQIRVLPQPFAGHITPSDYAAPALSAGVESVANFAYSRAAIVTGLLVDDAGAPLADFDIALNPTYYVEQTARTDATGRYRFELNSSTARGVSVEPYGHQGYTKRRTGAGAFATGDSLNGTTLELANLVLDRNGWITGSAFDDLGAELSGITVFTDYRAEWANCVPDPWYCTNYPQYYNAGQFHYEATTGSGSPYTLSAPAVSGVVVKPKKHADYTTPADAAPVDVPVNGAAASNVDFAYARRTTVTGTLTGVGGTLPTIRVSFQGQDGFASTSDHSDDHSYFGETWVDPATGTFALLLPSGAGATATIYANDFVLGFGYSFPDRHDLTDAELVAGATVTGKDFTWYALGSITGSVLDQDLAPLPQRANLHADSCDSLGRCWTSYATTASDGTYSLQALPGTATVYVDSFITNYGFGGVRGSTTKNASVAVTSGAATTGVDFEYKRWVTVSGRMRGDVGTLTFWPYWYADAYDTWGTYYFLYAQAVGHGGGEYSVSAPMGTLTPYSFGNTTNWSVPASRTLTVPAGGLVSEDWVWRALAQVTGALRDATGAAITGTRTISFAGVDPNATISFWVYLDPSATPRELLVELGASGSFGETDWEHRAYWGENLIAGGTEGTSSLLRIGDLPAAGAWTRLDIDADALAIGARKLVGMGVSVSDGQAWIDEVTLDSDFTDPSVWVDDALPPGARSWTWDDATDPAGTEGALAWDTTLSHAGTQSIGSGTGTGAHGWWFEFVTTPFGVPGAASGSFTQNTSSCCGTYARNNVTRGTYRITAPAVSPYSTPDPKVMTLFGNETTTVNFDYLFNDATAPVVSVTAPAAGATLRRNVSVTATATDIGGSGVQKVEFRANGTLIGTDTTASTGSVYSVTWSTNNGSFPDGSYTVEAKAYDFAGLSATSTVTVNVVNVSITGLVVDDLGTPLSGVQVALDPYAWGSVANATTDSAGRYRFFLEEASAVSHSVEPRTTSGYTKRLTGTGAYHTGTSQNLTTWNVPDLVMDRNGSIAGDITDDLGTALAGVTVFTDHVGYWANCTQNAFYCTDAYYRQFYNAGSAHYEATTDASGRYSLSAPGISGVVVKPKKTDGHTTPADAAPVTVPVADLATSDVDFSYKRSAAVSGALLANAGTLGAVRIEWFGYDGLYSGSSHSADHYYSGWIDLPAGTGSYSVYAPVGAGSSFRVYSQNYVEGYGWPLPRQHDLANLTTAEAVTGKDFSWRKNGTVTGLVHNVPAGSTIQLHISSQDSLGWGRTFYAQAAADGTFMLEALAGTGRVHVDTYVNGYGYGGMKDGTTPYVDVTVASDTATTGVEFEYVAWTSVSGTMRPDVGVLAQQPYTQGYSTDRWGNTYSFTAYGSTVPATLGTYSQPTPIGSIRFYSFRSYQHWDGSRWRTTYLSPDGQTLTVPADGLTGVDLVWTALGALTGTLFNPDGNPIAYGGYVDLFGATADSVFSAWVYLDPAATPREVMLQFHSQTGGGWEHRAYWGENLINWGVNGTPSRLRLGDLPAAGEWTRLDVPASLVGLVGHAVDGYAFTLYDGQAWWDESTVDTPTTEAGTIIDDALQPGAGAYGDSDGWVWDTTVVHSGTRSHKSPSRSGPHQHFTHLPRLWVDSTGRYSGDVLPGTFHLTPPNVNPFAAPPIQVVGASALATTTTDFHYTNAGTFNGTVTSGGTPLAGARICDDMNNCGVSDSAGNYSFRTPVGGRTLRGEFVVGYSVPAAQGPFAIALGTTLTVDWTYTVNGSVTGVVSDDLGAAFGGATVAFSYYHPRSGAFLHEYTATSDATTGAYTLSVPYGTGRSIVAKAFTGYRAPAAQSVDVVLGEAAPTVNFTYEKNGSLAGFLRDRQGGAVTGVTVTVYGPMWGVQTTSGSDGLYRFASLTPGTYSVYTGSKDGYVTPAAQTVAVPVRDEATANFEFVKQAKVSGHVQDDTGTALAGVWMYIAGYVQTDSAGNFSQFLAPGEYTVHPQDFTGGFGGYVTPPTRAVALAEGEELSLGDPFVYVRKLMLHVHVDDQDGGGLNGAPVYAYQDSDGDGALDDFVGSGVSAYDAMFDHQGVAIIFVPAGTTRLVAQPMTNYDPPEPPANERTVTGSPGDHLNMTDHLRYTRWGKIEGFVRDDLAAPLEGVNVYTTRGGSDATDATGFYSFSLARGVATVYHGAVARHLSADPKQVTVVSGTIATADFTLIRFGRVTGMVLTRTGTPLEAVVVSFVVVGAAPTTAATNLEGHFVIDTAPAAGVVRGNTVPGWDPPLADAEATVAPGATIDVGTLTYLAWGNVAGRIADASGAGIPGLTVRVDTGQTAVTDADGNYSIAAPRGTRSVSVDRTDGIVTPTVPAPTAVVSEQTTTLDLTAQPYVVRSGQVVDAFGNAVLDAAGQPPALSAFDAFAGRWVDAVYAENEIDFTLFLPPDSFTIHSAAVAGYTAPAPRPVAAGTGTIGDPIRYLQDGTLLISLLDDLGPLADVGVTIVSQTSGAQYTASTGADGTITLRLPVGTYVVTPHAIALAVTPAPASGLLAPGGTAEFAFAYRRYGEIMGNLVDVNGLPLQGFEVGAFLPGATGIFDTTDEQGVFKIRGPPTGADQSYTIAVSPKAHYVTPAAITGVTVGSLGLPGGSVDIGEIRVERRKFADLEVEVAVAPATVTEGTPAALSWRVRNLGDGPTEASQWQDAIYLSTDTTVDAGDTLLGLIAHSGTVGVGESYSVNANIQTPLGIPGTYFFLVAADAGNTVYEFTFDDDNVGATMSPTELLLAPAPDLAVETVTGPADAVAGGRVTVEWTVANLGDAAAAAGWVDRVYLSVDDTLVGAVPIGSFVHTQALAAGGSAVASAMVTLPDVADGSYRFVVVSDANQQRYERGRETNNTAASTAVALGHVNLTATAVTAAATAQSADSIDVQWTVTNAGSRAAAGAWSDQIYLSQNGTIGSGDRLLGEFAHSGPLGPGESYVGTANIVLPVDVSGEWRLIVRTDAARTVHEANAENDNDAASTPIAIALAPYADLEVTGVTAPTQLIADPARVTVAWTVTNVGVGAGVTSSWTDHVVLSRDAVAGNHDDIVLGRFDHVGALAVGSGYSRTETMFAPPVATGRFSVFVIADAGGVVFENAAESNNVGSPGAPLDLMPIPYADLRLLDVTVPETAQSGTLLSVTWTVRNDGIGRTDRESWADQVRISRNSDGSAFIVGAGFDHIGVLEAGGSYVRTGNVQLPNALSGPVYVTVRTSGPFEFVFDDALNTAVAGPVEVSQSPAPDLVVTDIAAPIAASEGDTVDITWTVRNDGAARASGTWADRIFLRKPGLDPDDPATPKPIVLGSFTYTAGLDPGLEYTRTERFTLPSRTEGGWQVAVTTDAFNGLFEGSPESANNTTYDDEFLLLSLKARPDLQVSSLTAPDRVVAGATAAVAFTVTNRGSVGTTTPHWSDRVYLSLDNKPGADDILIATLQNGSALGPDEAYASTTPSAVIPERFRGPGFFLVIADAIGAVDEYPADSNNYVVREVFVEAQPLADLVTTAVVVPTQAVYGAEITVRFTVANNGSAVTNRAQWTDTVWITKDKTRPSPGPRSVLSHDGAPIVIPGNDAIFLGSFGHSGALEVGASYEQEVKVRIPQQIDSGTYYITAWADAYDAVFEDSLATNVNPDDPTTLDSSNFKARAIDVIGTPDPPLPDLQVVQVTTDATAENPASTEKPLTVTWTVRNLGEGVAVGIGNTWFDAVFVHTTPNIDDPGANVWSLGTVERVRSLDPLASYTQTRTFVLSPATKGLYVTVFTDVLPEPPLVPESIENNNSRTAETAVVARPSNLVVTSVGAPAENFSGEKTTVTWTVRNDGGDVWSGTRLWSDSVWISPDPTFGNRARRIGSVIHPAGSGFAQGDSYTASAEVVVPAGFDGPYFLYVTTDLDAYPPTTPGATELWAGSNDLALGRYGGRVYEGTADVDNYLRGTIDVTYREPDLTITAFSLPSEPLLSGQDVTVTFTVANVGTRATREHVWFDRLYLSRDPSLDSFDLQIASFPEHWWGGQGRLGVGASYDRTVTFQIPPDAEGRFYLIAFTDSDVIGQEPTGAANVGVLRVRLLDDAVPEFRDEGNNTTVVPIDVTLAPAADLRVTSVVAPERALRGQALQIAYTVTNVGGAATPGGGVRWNDRIYLSADALLDAAADRYLGEVEHTGVVEANGGSYSISKEFKLPRDLTGAYYVFVHTDPVTSSGEPRGKVFEAGFEANNAGATPFPVLIERPPPSDLVVETIATSGSGETGTELTVSFTVRNKAGVTAEGSWADAVYLSLDSAWDLGDVLLGRAVHSGNVALGDSYSSQVTANLPPAKAGTYRIIVRADIFDEVYEAVDERNNITASESALAVTVPELLLGVPLSTTLSPGRQRVFKVTVGPGETLSIALDAADDLSANELFVRYGDVPNGFAFDFGAQQVLSADPSTLVPSTQAGDYYVLIQGRSGNANSAVKLTARALPFSVTDVVRDQGGDSRWVTTTISGARFQPGALVKLVRPGIAEVEPARYEVIDATEIIATFDLRNVPHGLYDVAVINPNGAVATLPYRYLVEDALPIDVTIGLGGPRVVPAGDTGLYSISLQSLTNVDTPYVYFTFGAPQLGQNPQVFGLPYVTFNSNVRGAPDGQRADVPWASLDSEVNTGGFMLAPGYAFDVSAGGYVGMSFAVTSYAGLKAIFDRDFEGYRNAVYDALPELAKQGALDAGISALRGDLARWFTDPNAKIDECLPLYIPFLFNVTAAATPMTRAEFVDVQSREAERLRTAVLADPTANAALVNLAADRDGWTNAYLGALEESGMLRPEDEAPPIRKDPKVVSLMATLASGILVGERENGLSGSTTLTAFFEQLHAWYGDTPNMIAPLIGYDVRGGDKCPECSIPVPKVASFEDFDLGLSHQTYFQSVNIFSPLGGGGAVDPLFSSLASSNTLTALDLQSLFDQITQSAAGATIGGPAGYGEQQYVPAAVALPYTVTFTNPADATTAANEVRVVSMLDDDLSVRTFRLGDMRIGGVTINVPDDRAAFQGDFDLRNSLGFIVRVSAGIDPSTRTARWVLQAIDPETGEVLQDTTRGLLLPNNAQGRGSGFVSWTAQSAFDAAGGAEISASARVQLDNQAPFETATVTSTLDGSAPETTLTATSLAAGSSDYVVTWQAVDEDGGSGVRHTTVYVRPDDGEWTIWQRQTTETQGVYEGVPGRAYQFLALSVDNAGNRESPPSDNVPGDGTVVDVGGLPPVGRTTRGVAAPPP